MRFYSRLLCLCVLIGCGRPVKETLPIDKDPFRITVSVSDGTESAMESELVFFDSFAFAWDSEAGKPITVFDLEEMTWMSWADTEVMGLTRCRAWTEVYVETKRLSNQLIKDPSEARYAKSVLEPELQVSEKEDVLILSNEYFRYAISGSLELNAAQLERYNRYEILNAYCKAMTDQMAPPFMQLFVSQEIKKRNVAPSAMVLEINNPYVSGTLSVKQSFEPVSAAEVKGFRKQLSWMESD